MKIVEKDPDAALDYKFDWAPLVNGTGHSNWLDTVSGEAIDTFVIDADSGIKVDSSAKTDTSTSVTVWLSGGTAGQTYDVRCEITTNASPARKDERTIRVVVEQR